MKYSVGSSLGIQFDIAEGVMTIPFKTFLH
jgi:hypothetical protein